MENIRMWRNRMKEWNHQTQEEAEMQVDLGNCKCQDSDILGFFSHWWQPLSAQQKTWPLITPEFSTKGLCPLRDTALIHSMPVQTSK